MRRAAPSRVDNIDLYCDTAPPVTVMTKRGTTNSNRRGNTRDRRARRRWLVATFRANFDALFDGFKHVRAAVGRGLPACRCYRCGELLTEETVTVDRIVPGAIGGKYVRNNIRPACASCNSSTGSAVRRSS